MFNGFLTQYDGAILGPIAKLLGLILNAIFEFLDYFGIENAGLCIIFFTFLVNALMIPLTIKQQKFTKLSSKMNPEIMKLQEKYKGKKDEASLRKQQLEMQAIYEKYGANPTSGCLPMLITFPIMFALYRVIYNIPAYVSSIKTVYENIAVKMLETDYLSIMTDYAHKFTNLNISKWGDISEGIPKDNLIDIMSQFKAADWSDLVSNDAFASISEVISTNADKIMHINNFGWGVNIMETPWQQITSSVPMLVKVLYLLIPILAVVTQMLQTKLMMSNTPQANGSDPSSAMMKSMNTFMPLMSGAFCLTLPVGVGIYWIAGAVFRIIQQIFVNKYMERMDVDALIEKNREKQKKKKEKRGIDPNVSMEELAKTRTSSIKDKAKVSASNTGDINTGIDSKNTYKSGSIAANAHMLSRNKGDKEEK